MSRVFSSYKLKESGTASSVSRVSCACFSARAVSRGFNASSSWVVVASCCSR